MAGRVERTYSKGIDAGSRQFHPKQRDHVCDRHGARIRFINKTVRLADWEGRIGPWAMHLFAKANLANRVFASVPFLRCDRQDFLYLTKVGRLDQMVIEPHFERPTPI